MGQRQTRGVMVGVFDQVEPGMISVRTMDPPPPGGRITISGLLVQPSQAGDEDLPPGDPLILGASRAATTEPVNLPVHQETREAAQQDVPRFPWWLLAAIIALGLA